MIDVHYWTTPNGHKVTIFLEETGLDYKIVPVNISTGEQFEPAFLEISPNNRIPAIVDHDPADSGGPLSVFESGAILIYLAEKTGRFMPTDLRGRVQCLEWSMWQMGNLGPMLGQAHHFRAYAPEPFPYAIERYSKEAERLYGILDERLEEREYLCGADYTIADMLSYPWTVSHERQGIDFAEFPNVARWFEAIKARPAVERAYEVARKVNEAKTVDSDQSKKVLFGQGRRKRA